MTGDASDEEYEAHCRINGFPDSAHASLFGQITAALIEAKAAGLDIDQVAATGVRAAAAFKLLAITDEWQHQPNGEDMRLAVREYGEWLIEHVG
jgi:hypothetical protein